MQPTDAEHFAVDTISNPVLQFLTLLRSYLLVPP